MAVVRALFRAELRHRWRSWLLLALLIALVSGVVLASASAGRRTATAFPRYEAAHGYDGFVYSPTPMTLSRLPEVSLSTPAVLPGSKAFTCAGCRAVPEGESATFDLSTAGLDHMVQLVAGRMPDPSNPYEVLASETLARDAGVHLGSVIHTRFASPDQRSAALADQPVVPTGPEVAFHVVGIEVAEQEFPATNGAAYDVFTTPAFARLIDRRTVNFYAYFVRLRHGASDLPRFETDARRLGGLSFTDLDTEAAAIDSSIRPQAIGWGILAALAGLAGIIVVAQALSRQATIEGDAYRTLSALGVARRQLFWLAMARTVAVGVVGVVGGLLLAFVLSPLAPVGEARLADPSPGLAFDLLLLLVGGLVALVVVAVLGVGPAIRTVRMVRPDYRERPVRPSRVVAALSEAGARPSMLLGVRHALERGRGRNAVPVGSALLGAVLAVTALCATVVFGSSLTHLTAAPALFGRPYDAYLPADATGSLAQTDRELATIEGTPGITAITAGIAGDIRIDGRTVDALAGRAMRGPLLLTAVVGRLPKAEDEISIGATTLRQLGVHVGSTVTVSAPRPTGGTRTSRFTVVGQAVFPPDFGTGGLGTGAVVALDALLTGSCPAGASQVACEVRAVNAAGGAFLVGAVAGPRGQVALAQLQRAYPQQYTRPVTPANLVNFGQAVNFPLLLGLVLILFGVATLLHVLLVSVTRRRREVGLLKALGFVRRQVAASVLWQTTTVGVVGVVVGVPAGIALGRLVWRAFATSLGVLPVPVVSIGVIAVVAVGALVLANLLAVGPALVAARSRPAALLQVE